MTSTRYVVWLAWRRVRRRESGALLAALGLAVGTAVLAAVLTGVTVATDRSTARDIERIPAAQRAVRAVWFGVPTDRSEAHAVLDREVREATEGLPLPGPTALVLVRESTVAGQFVGLAGVEGLSDHVILRSGRLPRRCTPERCEVLRLRGRGALPNAPGLRIVQVGTATLRTRQLFGDFLEPTDNATADAEFAPALQKSARYHRPAPAPLVVANGVDALAASPVLGRTYRSYAWVWPLGAGDPRLWQFGDLNRRVVGARAALAARSGSFAVAAPEEELSAAKRSAEVGGRRLLLVGGEAAALLLAFAVLAARGLRNDLDDARRRLTWYGASRWQLGLLVGVESALVAVGGVLAGWVLGTLAGAVASRIAGAPTLAVLGQSVLAPEGVAIAGIVAFVTAGLVAAAVSLRERHGGRVGAVDVLGAAALLVAAIALLGGAADEDRLARGEGVALLLLVVPGLVALAAAIAVARLFPPLARVAAYRTGRPLTVRLAAVGLARGHGAAVVTVAFLTLAFALALLAEGYRATLLRGEREQAAFEVPLDVSVREDLGTLVRVFDAAPLDRFRRLAGEDGGAYPVLRTTAGVQRLSGVTVLGLDPGAVERLRVWRPGWAGGAGRDDVAREIDPGRAVTLRSLPLLDGVITLGVGPGLVSLAAIVETPRGEFRRIELGDSDARRSTMLRARVPPGSRLVTLEVVPPRIIERGSDEGTALRGVSRLTGPLAVAMKGWLGLDGVGVRPADGGVDLRYVLTPQRRARIRAPQVTDTTPPSVLATPALAELAGGVGGVLPLQIGGARVSVRVARVVERFPGTPRDSVVVGDRQALETAINAAVPGGARADEVWLDVPEARRAAVAAALMRPPYSTLEARTRADLEADARRDPIANGTLAALAGAALVALVLAAVGLTLAVRADLRDDRGELYDLEAQGAAPSLLRRVIRARALTLSLAGLLAGAATGTLLVLLVTRMVTVTARGGIPEPPLVVAVDPGVVVAGVGVYLALAVVLVGAATRKAFRRARGPLAREED